VTRYVVRRLLQSIPLLFVISLVGFSLYHIAPNSPWRAELALNPDVDPQEISRIEAKYGLDQPIPVQYINWLVPVLHGDLGKSYLTKEPVLDTILSRLPNTLLLSGSAFILSLILGVSLGLYSALHRNSVTDNLIRAGTALFSAVPSWALGLILIIVLGGQLRLFPQGGVYTIGREGDILDRLHHLALPAMIAGLSGCIGFLRLTRTQTLEILGQDYVRTAIAKGLGWRAILNRHVLKNAMLPVWTSFGGVLAALVSGAALFEVVFSWPGIGRLLLESALKSDFPMLQAALMVGAVLTLIGYLVVDIGYAWLDPRVRLG
jgi:peptide/nickel transport system permease protein